MRGLAGPTAGAADGRFAWGALRALLPYLWPAGRPAWRARVVIALGFLALAKLATVAVPLLYKGMVDRFTDPERLVLELPLALLLAYGALRVLQIAFAELRDWVFARVAQGAIRDVALRTFRHLHGLALGFHSTARPAGCRVPSSAAPGHRLPADVHALQHHSHPARDRARQRHPVGDVRHSYALVTVATIAAYVVFTLAVTEWRCATGGA